MDNNNKAITEAPQDKRKTHCISINLYNGETIVLPTETQKELQFALKYISGNVEFLDSINHAVILSDKLSVTWGD